MGSAYIKDLHITFENNLMYVNDDRSLLTSIQAFGTLRKDLIENIGIERMKAFLFRYGWNLGEIDGSKALEGPFETVEERVKYGPVLHSLKGHVLAKVTDLRLVVENGKLIQFKMEGTWEESYEAVEHMNNFGQSHEPVCYALIGYASGYISKVTGETVLFKEVECAAMGASTCKWIGMPSSKWGPVEAEQLRFFKNPPILQELEVAHEKLLEERNTLAKVMAVHKLLTEEIIKGNHYDSIARIMYEQTGIPILIEDIHHLPVAYEGLNEDVLNQVQEEFLHYINRGENKTIYYQTTTVKTPSMKRLISPIFLQGNIIGYCSFFYKEDEPFNSDIAVMFIERVSSVCSLLLLNERTQLESEGRMKGHFLNEILSGQYDKKEDILRRGRLIQLDLSHSYSIVAIEYKLISSNESLELSIYEQIIEVITNFFKEKKICVLVGKRDSHIVILDAGSCEANAKHVNQLIKDLVQTFPKVHFKAGVSLKKEDILEAAKAYKEALTALRTTSYHERIVHFKALGIIGILLNNQNKADVEYIAKYKLGDLYDLNDERKVDLLETLYVYLQNGGNLEQTAEQLALSVSGLRYRMNKVDALLGNGDRTAEENIQLYLALQSLKLIGKLDSC